MFPPNGSKNDDGLEMQFGTNVVSPFAFSEKLFPLLRETAKKSSPGSVRVVWVSSSGHYIFAKKDGINFDSINKDVKLVGNQCHYGQRWVKRQEKGGKEGRQRRGKERN